MTPRSRSMTLAMLSAAAVTAQFVSGKAMRDALFLTTLDVTKLPAMLVATSLCSIVFVTAYARAASRLAPATLVPLSFVVSGLLMLAEWFFRTAAPSATAVTVYLQISGVGPLLASGFWLIASERFDPRTAKRHFGRIAGAGTLGGLFGALVVERVAAVWGGPSVLILLAAFQFLTAWFVRRLAVDGAPIQMASTADEATVAPAPGLARGLRAIAEAPHLRHLAALVLLGTTSAALLDYVFKAKAVETFGHGDSLLRFFALYYAVTSLISFVLQVLGSRAMLERFGLAMTTSTPSVALLAGSIGGLVAPGFGSVLVARAGESIFRASWFRAGYELFYTPIAASEKRAVKSVIDVAFDRIGDALGGSLVRLAIFFAPVAQYSAIVAISMASSIAAIVAASHLNRWYIRTLESSLRHQAGDIDLSDASDGSGDILRVRATVDATSAGGATRRAQTVASTSLDPIVADILALKAGGRGALAVLSREDGLPAPLVAHVIPLLAVDALADHALFALRKVAEERVGELTDALVDPNHEYAVRRRLARVFSVAVSQRAVDGLALGLEDPRFDVRFQAARSLAAVLDRNPRVVLDADGVYEAVLREVAVGHPVWESQRLLDGFVSESPLDEFVKDRAGQSLAHVFTLLSLVLPREPLRIAFRSLTSDDRNFRGTALEYLEEVLPARVRQPLWPFLVPRRPSTGAPQTHDQIIADLLRSSQSITLHGIANIQVKPILAGFEGI